MGSTRKMPSLIGHPQSLDVHTLQGGSESPLREQHGTKAQHVFHVAAHGCELRRPTGGCCHLPLLATDHDILLAVATM